MRVLDLVRYESRSHHCDRVILLSGELRCWHTTGIDRTALAAARFDLLEMEKQRIRQILSRQMFGEVFEKLEQLRHETRSPLINEIEELLR